MSIHRNHNYRIGTDQLEDGRIKAKARGRKTNVRTFPAGTTHEQAALALATLIEGERIAEVRELTSVGHKRDYAVFTRPFDAQPEPVEPAPIVPEEVATDRVSTLKAGDTVEAMTAGSIPRQIRLQLSRAPWPAPAANRTVISGPYGANDESAPVAVLTDSIRLIAPASHGDLIAALDLPKGSEELARAITTAAEEAIDGSITRGDGYNWQAVLWFFGRGTQEPGAFVAKLMEAMAAADSTNRKILVRAFPAIGIPFRFAKDEVGGLDAIATVARVEARHGNRIGMKELRNACAEVARLMSPASE